MANFSHTATTTSSPITGITDSVRTIVITNTGTNPVYIRAWEDGAAVAGEWIVLPVQWSSFTMDLDDGFLWKFAAISTWWSSSLAIFTRS